MSVPEITEEQRAAALAKAMEVRSRRAATLKSIKRGEAKALECLEKARSGEMPHMQKVKVYKLLAAIPGVGNATATQIMQACGILERHTLKSIGAHQVESLRGELVNRGLE